MPDPKTTDPNHRSHHSLLTTLQFRAVGPIRPSLVRGLRPRNAPPKTSRRSECVRNVTLSTRGNRASNPLHFSWFRV